MPEHVQYEDDDLFNPETHHEESDVPLKPLWWALALFVIFGGITHIVLYFMYHGMVNAEKTRMDPPQTTVARPANAGTPQNQPLLQPFPHAEGADPGENTPVTDLKMMRAAEDRVLQHYGWVDKEHGVVHIPIDQAKDMVATMLSERNAGVPPAGPAASSPPGSTSPSTGTSGLPAATTTAGGAH